MYRQVILKFVITIFVAVLSKYRYILSRLKYMYHCKQPFVCVTVNNLIFFLVLKLSALESKVSKVLAG